VACKRFLSLGLGPLYSGRARFGGSFSFGGSPLSSITSPPHSEGVAGFGGLREKGLQRFLRWVCVH